MAKHVKEADFQLDSLLSEKAVGDDAYEKENGDLIIEGWAGDYTVDRQGEAFEPGAFEQGLSEFLALNPTLLYHHHNDQQLGQVLELQPKPEGLWMKAVVAKPHDSSPLADVYQKIKRGMMRGLSIRGKFHRRQGADGIPRIHRADIAEISVTPFPVGPRTLFAVSQKAFADAEEGCDCGDSKAATETEETPETVPTEAYMELAKQHGDLIQASERLAEAAGISLEAKADPEPPAEATTAEVEGDQKNEGKRAEWAKKGIAMKDGSFPITHCGTDSYSNGAARSRVGSAKGKSKESILAHIAKREKALGCSRKDDDE